MYGACKQGATTALRTVLVINPVFAIVTPLLGVWCFGYILQCFTQLNIAFTETGEIGARICGFSGFLAVAASFKKYTGSGTCQSKHGNFS